MADHEVATDSGYRLRVERPKTDSIRLRMGPYNAAVRPTVGDPGEWATLAHNLFSFGGGTTGRVRYTASGDTYLYTGIRHGSGSTEDLKVFNVSTPSKLAYKGGVEGVTWGGAGMRHIPQFWPDEWPDVIGIGVPQQGGTGNAEPGGVQIVDIGPSSAPHSVPVLHSWSAVTFGSISGGSLGFPVQHDNRIYFFSRQGFVQVSRLNYAILTGTTITSAGEVGWFGNSESLPNNLERHWGPADYDPTQPYLHSFNGTDYSLLFQETATIPAFITADAAPGNDNMSGLWHFYDEPVHWKLRQRLDGSSNRIGVEILYVDVTNPVAPFNDTTWTILTEGELLGQNQGLGQVQATYDHDKLLFLMKFGTGAGATYTLYRVNFVTREILNEWDLPIPPPSINPYGTFTTRNASYFGRWDASGVYLLDLGIAPERDQALGEAKLARIRRK